MMVIGSTGCSTYNRGGTYNNGFNWLFATVVEQPVNSYRERVWAQRSFNLRYPSCDSPFPSDFKAGFIEGYCAACRGADEQAPPLPPESYWSTRYTTEQGAKKAEAWFAGYPAGARAAKADGVGEYSNIRISTELMNIMAEVRNGNEQIVAINSIGPRLPQSTPGEANWEYAGPDFHPPAFPAYQESSEIPVIRSNRKIPAMNSGAPLGVPSGTLNQ